MLSLCPLVLAAGGWATGNPARIAKGREVYGMACAACHGADGRGNDAWENPVRPADLSDCAATTSEPAEHWATIVRRGGPARGLNSVMPAFAEAFNEDEIGAVVAYLRTFCARADTYPPGDLNFRRPIETDKAFPESEVVLRASHRPNRETRETELEAIYENRIGPRFQYEVELPMRPLSSHDPAGLGDIKLEGKQVLHFDLRKVEILSAGSGLALPTGKTEVGNGTTILTPFVAYGKGWRRTFLQARLGAELPWDRDKAAAKATYALAVSHTLGPARTAWAPAVEFVGAFSGESEHAVFLEVSKPLSKLGHVIASVGVQIPYRPKGQSYRLEAYVLWDFGDGPLWVGW